jgi:Lhr-like helicase
VPRWGGDGLPLSEELARRLYLARVRAAEALRDGRAALLALLRHDYGLGDDAAALLAAYFERQETASEAPDVSSLLVEVVGTDLGDDVYLHTPLNRGGNDALARVAVRRLARDHGRSAVTVVADLGLVVKLRGPLPSESVPGFLRGLLRADGLDADLLAALEAGGVVNNRFAKVAQTGLMLLRQPLGRRRRVGGAAWAERRLAEQVRAHDPDFVLLRQARREALAAACADTARRYAEELPRLEVRVRRLPRPSPFAESWLGLDSLPAEDAETPEEALRRLHAALFGGGAGG